FHEKFGSAYVPAINLNYRTNNALLYSFSVNVLNELSTVANSGTLTVGGTTYGPATSVTVNSLAAARYADNTFAKDGFTVSSGNNTFTAVAQDSYGRSSTDQVTVN